jgi:hypothetical protein
MSHKHDDLAQMWLDRETRDACGFSAELQYDIPTNSVVGFTATSTGTCKYAVSGALPANPPSGVTSETYGGEKTIWIEMAPNTPVEVTFDNPIPMF